MGKYLEQLENKVKEELKKVKRQADLTKQSALEVSKAAAASPSQSGDREHSKNQAFITEDRLKLLEKVYSELQSSNREDQQDEVSPPIHLIVEIDGHQQQFYLMNDPLNIPGTRIVSVNSPLGKAVMNKKVGEEFEYNVSSQKIKGKILDIST